MGALNSIHLRNPTSPANHVPIHIYLNKKYELFVYNPMHPNANDRNHNSLILDNNTLNTASMNSGNSPWNSRGTFIVTNVTRTHITIQNSGGASMNLPITPNTRYYLHLIEDINSINSTNSTGSGIDICWWEN